MTIDNKPQFNKDVDNIEEYNETFEAGIYLLNILNDKYNYINILFCIFLNFNILFQLLTVNYQYIF